MLCKENYIYGRMVTILLQDFGNKICSKQMRFYNRCLTYNEASHSGCLRIVHVSIVCVLLI